MLALLKYQTAKRFSIFQLLSKMAHYCFFSLFAVFLSDKGYTVLDISIINTVYSVGIVCFELPTGIIADKIRRDKCIHLSSLLMAIAYLMIYLSQEYFVLVLSNIMMALSGSFMSGVIDVWLIDGLETEGSKEGLEKVSALMMAANSVGATLGLIIGGFIALFSLNATFLIGLILIILTCIVSFLLIDNRSSINKTIREENLKNYICNTFMAITAPFLAVSIAMAFLSFAIASPLSDHWQIYFNDKGIDNKFVLSNIYSIRTVLVVLGGAIAGRISNIFHKDNLYIFRIFISCSAICLILSAIIPQYWIALFCWSLISLFNAVGRSFWNAKLITTMEVARRSTLFSVNSLIFSGASVLGSLIMGGVALNKGISVAWVCCGGVLVISVLFSVFAQYLANKKDLTLHSK